MRLSRTTVTLHFLIILPWLFIPVSAISGSLDYDCLLLELEKAESHTTIGELRKTCGHTPESPPTQQTTTQRKAAQEMQSALDNRIEAEKIALTNPFVLLPHKTNYFLFGNYHFNDINTAPWEEPPINETPDFQNIEAKFQVSIKAPIVQNLLGDNGHLYFAYTNLSVWQIYNKDLSSPFRDINHEPEAWISFDNDWSLMGWRNRVIDAGIVHQSNGRSDPLSRSWNRIYARFLFEKGNSVLLFKPWYRIKESPENDDNPDITDYLGNFELGGATRRGKSGYSFLLRNNLKTSDNRGMIQLGWTYPVYKNLRFYTQWFYGYGESLIDYNYRNNALGIGLQYGDWL
jgi:phospholipase A1